MDADFLSQFDLQPSLYVDALHDQIFTSTVEKENDQYISESRLAAASSMVYRNMIYIFGISIETSIL